MEDFSKPQPEEELDKDEELEKKPAKAKRQGFLASWLARRAQPLETAPQQQEGSEKIEEVPTKDKLWKKLGSILFGGYLTQGEKKTVESNERRNTEEIDFFGLLKSQSIEEGQRVAPAENQEEAEAMKEPEPQPQLQKEVLVAAAEVSRPREASEQRQWPEPIIPELGQFEKSVQQAKEAAKDVDWESRQRDRKILATQQQEQELGLLRIKHEAKELKRADKRLEKKIDETLEKHNEAHEAVSPAPAKLEIDSLQKAEIKQESKEHGELKIVREKSSAARPPEFAPPPEIILKQVAEAAEKDLPIEALFERSHEIKDKTDQKNAAAGPGPVAIGEQLQKMYGKLSQERASIEGKSAESQQRSVKVTGSEVAAPSIYKQAAQSGFITGVVIVAIIITAALLS